MRSRPNKRPRNRMFQRVISLSLLSIMFGCGPGPASLATAKLPPMKGQESSHTSEADGSGTQNVEPSDFKDQKAKKMEAAQLPKKTETATLAGGCFWCVEAVFQKLKGVEAVRSGYMGGRTINPTYDDICTGLTGHAEVIQVDFDPEVISFPELLEVFWTTHDPTTLNRQGNDVGTQYRSAVFYHNEAQQAAAEKYKKQLNEAKVLPSPIVTEIVPAKKMYVAEDYHQNYFNENPNQRYCRATIPPKLAKLKKVFADKLKDEK